MGTTFVGSVGKSKLLSCVWSVGKVWPHETFVYLCVRYLEGRIQSGDSESISCPEYACYRRVPLVGPDVV